MERTTPFRATHQPATRLNSLDPRERKTASVGIVLVALGVISAVVMTEMYTLLDAEASSSSFLSSLLRSDDRSGPDASKLPSSGYSEDALQERRRGEGSQPKVTITISL